MTRHVTYQDFFTAEEVATYKRVKRGSMRLAHVAREVLCEMVGGTLSPSGKEFLRTNRGTYRLSMGENSDNSTERVAHDQMGAIPLVMGNEEEMTKFFIEHNVDHDPYYVYTLFLIKVKQRLEEPE